MKKLISPNDLQTTLKANYRYFVDEHCRLVHIELFETLFIYKYANAHHDYWQYWIQKDQLHCENISKMTLIFPLEK